MYDKPYYAVIFTSLLVSDISGYAEMAEEMECLAKQQPGFLGLESARNETGITISYWKDQKSILEWKKNLQHQEAQRIGKQRWYSKYSIRICKVEREYHFKKKENL